MNMKRANHGRLRYSKRWDDGGVASTVGTIMAIMVILVVQVNMVVLFQIKEVLLN